MSVRRTSMTVPSAVTTWTVDSSAPVAMDSYWTLTTRHAIVSPMSSFVSDDSVENNDQCLLLP